LGVTSSSKPYNRSSSTARGTTWPERRSSTSSRSVSRRGASIRLPATATCRHVVSSVTLPAASTVERAAPRGHHQDGDVPAAAAEPLQPVHPVAVRQSQVEQDQVVVHGVQGGFRIAQPVEGIDREAAPRQPALHQGGKTLAVLDQQDSHARFRPVTIAHTRFSR
jgi:hypothetical protein